MSAKNLDQKGRFRSKVIAFRVSPEENDQINRFIAVSGFNKQDYLIHNMLQSEIVVKCNPKVHKALKNAFEQIVRELQRIGDSSQFDDEFLDYLKHVIHIYESLSD